MTWLRFHKHFCTKSPGALKTGKYSEDLRGLSQTQHKRRSWGGGGFAERLAKKAVEQTRLQWFN